MKQLASELSFQRVTDGAMRQEQLFASQL